MLTGETGWYISEPSILSSQFLYKSKTVFKNKAYYKNEGIWVVIKK